MKKIIILMLCFIIGYTVSAKSDYDVIENNNYLNIISQHVLQV